MEKYEIIKENIRLRLILNKFNKLPRKLKKKAKRAEMNRIFKMILS